MSEPAGGRTPARAFLREVATRVWWFDGTAKWTPAGLVLDSPVHALAVDPAHPEVVYAGTDIGVWKGVERETTYSLYGDDASPYLVPTDSAACLPGDVSVLVPPDEDIHRVENAGDDIAISVHFYGDDIAVHGSSINHSFAEGRVRTRPAASDGAPRSWRQSQPA